MALATTYFEDGARLVSNPTMISGEFQKFMPTIEPGDLLTARDVFLHDIDENLTVQLTIDDEDDQRTDAMMDMLLAKKRSEDRRNWLQEKGDMAEIEV